MCLKGDTRLHWCWCETTWVVAFALQSEGLTPQQEHVLQCLSYQLNISFLKRSKDFSEIKSLFCDMDWQMPRHTPVPRVDAFWILDRHIDFVRIRSSSTDLRVSALPSLIHLCHDVEGHNPCVCDASGASALTLAALGHPAMSAHISTSGQLGRHYDISGSSMVFVKYHTINVYVLLYPSIMFLHVSPLSSYQYRCLLHFADTDVDKAW